MHASVRQIETPAESAGIRLAGASGRPELRMREYGIERPRR
ncbi:MAG: hypothetical protein QM674_08515 [Burkholderiaceae bacterium]